MKKMLAILNMVALLTFLMGVGLVLYMVGTHRLDKEKEQTILDLVRHPGTPAELRLRVADILQPAAPATATAPATAPAAPVQVAADSQNMSAAASAAERIEFTRQAMEQERLRVEHDAQELQHRQQLLDQKRAEIDAKLAELDAQKKSFDAQVAATQAQGQNEAFNKSLDLYNELKPKQVKDIFMGQSPDNTANYLKAMDISNAAKIIAEFKSPEEKAYITSVLEKIRTASPASGTPSASDPPATAPAESAAARVP